MTAHFRGSTGGPGSHLPQVEDLLHDEADGGGVGPPDAGLLLQLLQVRQALHSTAAAVLRQPWGWEGGGGGGAAITRPRL